MRPSAEGGKLWADSAPPDFPLDTFDPHQVLGLAPPASADEIRRAFRRLAMRWHPDRNPSPEASERFRLIRAAHDALLVETEALESDGAARGPVEEGELVVSLEEAVFGGKKTFTVVRRHPCAVCGGEGDVPLQYSRLCEPCHGTGRLRRASGLERCGVCEGKGYRFKARCEACDGSGEEIAERELAVTLPPLSAEGRILRLQGQGPGPVEAPGDLLLAIRYQDHPLFARRGVDLALEVPVSVLAWLAGDALSIPILGGTHRVNLRAGGGERELRLPEFGLPRLEGGRGELRVTLRPEFPQALDASALEALLSLDRSLAGDEGRHYPEVAAWRRRVQAAGAG